MWGSWWAYAPCLARSFEKAVFFLVEEIMGAKTFPFFGETKKKIHPNCLVNLLFFFFKWHFEHGIFMVFFLNIFLLESSASFVGLDFY